MSSRKVILYIAMSLDGYIAGPGDNLDFLSAVEQEGEDYGYADFIKTVDTVILGRRTYEKVLSFGIPFPHADRETYVVTRTPRPADGKITFYTGALQPLIAGLKQRAGKNIFIDGGAMLVHALLEESGIDELVISIIPVLLGDGIPLFRNGRPEAKLRLIHTASFEKGLVQLRYAIGESDV
jgi:dihydrofolate reductase